MQKLSNTFRNGDKIQLQDDCVSTDWWYTIEENVFPPCVFSLNHSKKHNSECSRLHSLSLLRPCARDSPQFPGRRVDRKHQKDSLNLNQILHRNRTSTSCPKEPLLVMNTPSDLWMRTKKYFHYKFAKCARRESPETHRRPLARLHWTCFLFSMSVRANSRLMETHALRVDWPSHWLHRTKTLSLLWSAECR